MFSRLTFMMIISTIFISCEKSDSITTPISEKSYPAIEKMFGSNIQPASLPNYSHQLIPNYITKDNGMANPLDNKKATLGRVLFYDKSLSIDQTVSCASCHQQQFAFSDTAFVSRGVQSGETGRHSMRLINSRFGNEVKFFWDERATNLENQTTQPIKDHAEMGFSGQSGRPEFSDLINTLKSKDYYQELFEFVYGDQLITENRLQQSLANFIRSIQSFDSKYDVGRAQVNNDGQPFPNFSAQENQGKQLFLIPPQFNGLGQRIGGGIGCAGCHRPPEFDIDPNSLNNGVIGKAHADGQDYSITRSPSLRDIVKTDGTLNGGLMHTGNFTTLLSVINHYNQLPNQTGNTNLDPRLRPGGTIQNLQMTEAEKNAVIAFLRTLSGTNVYTDSKWATPFMN